MTATLRDAAIVVRECGERTAREAVARLSRMAEDGAVLRVREVPFTEALRVGLRVGLEAGRRWTLCVDADVLVCESGAAELLQQAEAMPDDAFELQGLVFDKFFAVNRPGGIHLYRTGLVPRALDLVPPEGKGLRPESIMLGRMARAGHPWLQSRVRIGVHDFEQHYADVWRKCFLQAHKHRQHHHYLERLWAALAPRDPDFRVALAAFDAGIAHDGPVRVSKAFRDGDAPTALAALGLEEKPPAGGPLCPAAMRDRLLRELSPELRELAARQETDMIPATALPGPSTPRA